MPLQDTPFGVFAAAYGAYLLLGLLGQRAGELLMGRWRAGLDVGFLSTSKRKVHVSPQVFSTSRMEPWATLLSHCFGHTVRLCTTMVLWSSSDAWGNLLLQVFPNDAQCQVLPRIFCLNISHFQQDMHQPMAWWIFQPKHVTRGGCLENWGCHSSTCWWLVGRPDDQLANTEVDSQPLHVPVALRMLKIIPQLNLLHNTHFFPDNQNWETFFQVGFRISRSDSRNGGISSHSLQLAFASVGGSGASGPGLLPWNCTEGMALKIWICLEVMHLDLGRKSSPRRWVDELVDWWVEEWMMSIFFFRLDGV